MFRHRMFRHKIAETDVSAHSDRTSTIAETDVSRFGTSTIAETDVSAQCAEAVFGRNIRLPVLGRTVDIRREETRLGYGFMI